VIDDHDRHLPFPEHLDGISQSPIAIAIQIGIWLIEYDEDGPFSPMTVS